MRVVTVLLSGWVVLTMVERGAEQAPWPTAVLAGLMWSCVVAGVWWFAEWTQSARATAPGEFGDPGQRADEERPADVSPKAEDSRL
ncbi:hypothetical protein [Streptomyces sp. SP18CS02]|uniref:hypothetical protein n=1 Tax=Streptomyces sp. SP18CS02 TaxID=3002531 RepID=UPI002E75BD1E|nr:hypothetical protein [Streptomyces sp. SP18CS02]MEE1752937.1 hypothetical protein [Streptomyces sp. SP18CS02]